MYQTQPRHQHVCAIDFHMGASENDSNTSLVLVFLGCLTTTCSCYDYALAYLIDVLAKPQTLLESSNHNVISIHVLLLQNQFSCPQNNSYLYQI